VKRCELQYESRQWTTATEKRAGTGVCQATTEVVRRQGNTAPRRILEFESTPEPGVAYASMTLKERAARL
jgi:hypothetical protein